MRKRQEKRIAEVIDQTTRQTDLYQQHNYIIQMENIIWTGIMEKIPVHTLPVMGDIIIQDKITLSRPLYERRKESFVKKIDSS